MRTAENAMLARGPRTVHGVTVGPWTAGSGWTAGAEAALGGEFRNERAAAASPEAACTLHPAGLAATLDRVISPDGNKSAAPAASALHAMMEFGVIAAWHLRPLGPARDTGLRICLAVSARGPGEVGLSRTSTRGRCRTQN